MELLIDVALNHKNIIDQTIEIAKCVYNISLGEEKDACERLTEFLSTLDDNLCAIIEYPYVDKLYRDSYYNYFSTKYNHYPKDVIRISFFDKNSLNILENTEDELLTLNHFLKGTDFNNLQDSYKGFLCFRPIFTRVIGRNVISPTILKDKSICVRTTVFNTTVAGIKFKVDGFPHCNQEVETISCSETTLWAIMEYFSFSYPEYRPSLPSTITETLKKVTHERQIPSNGLDVQQLSFALREFGFAPRIYSKEAYPDNKQGISFSELFSCYVESGIPMILALNGKIDRKKLNVLAPMKKSKDGISSIGDGHAVICIGREEINASELRPHLEVIKKEYLNTNNENVVIYDYDLIEKRYVFMDDNFPPYRKWSFGNPELPANWRDFKPTSFIVPLYKRVHLEATKVKELINQILTNSVFMLSKEKKHDHVVLRTFLTSSRTLKDNYLKSKYLDVDIKTQISLTALPRFVWVTELSTLDLIEKERANGFIILDATEADTAYYKPLIFLYIWDKFCNFATRSDFESTANNTFMDFENKQEPEEKNSTEIDVQFIEDTFVDFDSMQESKEKNTSEIETQPIILTLNQLSNFEIFKGNFTYADSLHNK